MARRSNTVLLSVGMLSTGLALGGHLHLIQMTTPAQAVSAVGTVLSSGADVLMMGGEHIGQIAASVMPSTVHIQAVRRESDGRKMEETGSGVVMRSQTVNGFFVVTNNHVVRGAKLPDIQLRLEDGRVTNPVKIYRDEETDLAVLMLSETGLKAGRWGDSGRVNIGNYVLAVGSPFGLSKSVTMGIVSAKGRRDLSLTEDHSVTNQDFIQTDAAINPGNSGGPLIDMDGNVVGINTAIASNSGGSEGIGFSIPSQLAQHVFEHLVSNGQVRRGYLGVELNASFSSETAERLGLRQPSGAHVTRVYRERPTPASQAGIRPDDVIIGFNGVRVEDENHLINLVGIAEIGQAISLEIVRSGRRMPLSVTLTDRTEQQKSAERDSLTAH